MVVEVPLGVGALEMDGDAAVGREVVDGEAREHRLGAQDAAAAPVGTDGRCWGTGTLGWVTIGVPPFLPEVVCLTHDTVCVCLLYSLLYSLEA